MGLIIKGPPSQGFSHHFPYDPGVLQITKLYPLPSPPCPACGPDTFCGAVASAGGASLMMTRRGPRKARPGPLLGLEEKQSRSR